MNDSVLNDAFLLHLRGPLQSYADTGFGQIREAGLFPSRSAVLGIVAAAMGVPRLDTRLVALHDALCVHVATARPGEVRTDFHTVDAGGKNKTVTYRAYHHDAHFIALLEARTPQDAGLLDAARQALNNPHYVPYLGRRSCAPSVPLLPLAPQGDERIGVLLQAVTSVRSKWHAREKAIHLYLDTYLNQAQAQVAVEDVWSGAGRVAVRYGERRDRLVHPRRAYAGRPYTAMYLTDDPQQAYFDAAS